MKKISIVCSLYKSEQHLEEFHQRALVVLKKENIESEFVFVIDGCPHKSLDAARSLQKRHPNILIVELSRNFGHHRAMGIGLKFASSEFVFLTDVDLEEPPEILQNLIGAMTSDQNIDVAYAKANRRKGSWFEKISGKLFYFVFNFLSDTKIPDGGLVSRLMKRKYVDALLQFQEREVFAPGLWEMTGFNQVGVPALKISRAHASTYSFGKKVSLAINAVTSFSDRPLRLIFGVGTIIIVFSFVSGIYFIVKKLNGDIAIPGWTSILVAICFFSGLIIFFLGIIGVYISKIFIEVKQRPYEIIKNIYKETD